MRRCAFNTGLSRVSDVVKIRMKYSLMRLEGITYPDVYCFPFWLGYRCHFLRNGEKISGKKYDYILSELNSSAEQLEYLLALVRACPDKTIVFPGPPEIFLSRADSDKMALAREILATAEHVWAYSEGVAQFADRCAGTSVARIIPWPFDYCEVRRLGGIQRRDGDYFDILIGAPLRFAGIACNAPEHLEESIASALDGMAETDRKKFRFYAFVYADEDRHHWRSSNFGKRVGITLLPRMGYARFLKFLNRCAGVIQLLSVSALGRITYASAALGKPGIFSAGIGLSRRLYPNSLVSSPTDADLNGKVGLLLNGVLGGQIDPGFLPDAAAARAVGDFERNAEIVSGIMRN